MIKNVGIAIALAVSVGFLLFAASAKAQVLPAQNQVTATPYGGLVYATSSSATAKLYQLIGAAYGQIPYWDGTKWDKIATSSLGLAPNFSVTYPLQYAANILSLAFGTTTSNTWAGIQTFTNSPVLTSLTGGLVASNPTTDTLYNSATTSVTCSGSVTCTGFDVLGPSPITISSSGGSGSSIATSSTITVPQLAYFTGTTPTSLGGVSTTTFTPSSEFTIGGTLGALVGGSNSTLTIATNGIALTKIAQIAANSVLGNATGGVGNVTAFATSTLFGAGTNGFVLGLVNGLPSWVATSTLANITGTLPIANGGTATTTFYDTGILFYNSALGTISQTSRVDANHNLTWDRTTPGLGAGTTTPWGMLSVSTSAGFAAGAPQLTIGSSTRQDFIVTQGGNTGVGTTSPGSLFSINGVANFQTGTSTIYMGLRIDGNIDERGTATSTFTNGVTLSGGCYAIAGVCLPLTNTTGTLPINRGGTATTTFYNGGITFYNSTLGTISQSANASVASRLFWDNTNGRLGVGTSSPNKRLSVQGNAVVGDEFSPSGFPTTGGVLVSNLTANSNIYVGQSATNNLNFGWTYNATAANATAALATFSYSNDLQIDGRNIIIQANNTFGKVGIGTTTPLLGSLTIATTTAAQLNLSAGAGVAQWVQRNAGGNLYFATTTIAGTATTSTSALTMLGSNGFFGLASSSPWANLSIAEGGAVVVGEFDPATSTSMTIDWRQGNQQLIRHGASATTIGFSNFIDGQKLVLTICNPTSAGGAITFSGVLWTGGTAPTQTTTANKCDVWSFLATRATSTMRIFGAATLNF